MKRLIFFNAPVLTAYGEFCFKLCSTEETKELIKKFESENKEIISAIGHEATAEIMSETLGYEIKMNRFTFKQTIDDTAIIFRLKKRAKEGEILERKDIEEIGFEFGVLTKIS